MTVIASGPRASRGVQEKPQESTAISRRDPLASPLVVAVDNSAAKLNNLATTLNADGLREVLKQLPKGGTVKASETPQPQTTLAPKKESPLANEKNYQALESWNKQRLDRLYESLPAEGQSALLSLLKRTDPATGKSILMSVDSSKQTMLQNLSELQRAKSLATPELNAQRADVTTSLLRVLAYPDCMHQGPRGTCEAATALWQFATKDPAEMSRISTDLILKGESKFRGGETLTLEKDAVAKPKGDYRTDMERILQASFMEYANGALKYSDAKNGSYDINGKRVSAGLRDADQVKLLEAFYATRVTLLTGNSRDMMKVVGQKPGGGIVATMRWAVVEPKPGEVENTAVSGEGFHAISVLGIKDGRVYFRNPVGPLKRNPGDLETNPPRRYEDPGRSVESMDVKEFEKRVHSIRYKE